MRVQIARFAPAEASQDDLARHHEVAVAVQAVNYPERPLQSLEYYTTQLRSPVSLLGPRRFWVARQDGRLVGPAAVALSEPENRDVAITRVQVLPETRRLGIGSALLRTTLPDCLADGRHTVVAYGIKVGSDGERWALALGFKKVQEFALQTLSPSDVDPGLWQAPAPVGFNTHMIRVNHQIGYRIVHVLADLETDTEGLQSRLR